MTQDEFIEMARQVGIIPIPDTQIMLELVAEKAFRNGYKKGIAAFNDAVLIEREACAKIADEWSVGWPHPSRVIAERIRARGET
jgi:hypothetical protein